MSDADARTESPPERIRLPNTASFAPVALPSAAADSLSARPVHRRTITRRRHRAQRTGAVEIARQHVDHSFVPELEIGVDDIERRDRDEILIERQRALAVARR